MRIAFPYNDWRGGFLKSIQNACDKLGHETYMLQNYHANVLNKIARRSFIQIQKNQAVYAKEKAYNQNVFRQLVTINPDMFFNISGSGLFPQTVKTLKEKVRCTTICLVADNPCDPAPYRDKYFAMSLQYYDILLSPEPVWTKLIRNLAPNARIIKFLGGYDPLKFFPILEEDVTDADRTKYSCDVSFTGGSYGDSPEGSYRAGILGQLDEFDVKIWGDEGWQFRFGFYPLLKNAFQGERLDYANLRKLYTLSTVNVNMPSPQILTSFQPRVFEIAANRGFQIIDHSDELFTIFDKDEVATFKGIQELKDKICYYKQNVKERMDIIDAMYDRVVKEFTWESQIKKVLENI